MPSAPRHWREAAGMTGINIFKHSTSTVTLETGEVVFSEGDPGDGPMAPLRESSYR
jgi:hypothetical protein